MTTVLYFHALSSTVSGTLPSTEQSTNTPGASFDLGTVNRSMDTTKGTTATSLTKAIAATAGEKIYVTKFVSQPLDSSSTSITANTWTYSASYFANSGSPTWPTTTTGGSVGKIPSTLYVWRPSTGALVGKIFDGDSTTTTSYIGSVQSTGIVVQFTGSSVTATTGDVLIFEAWGTGDAATSAAYSYRYDGNSATISDNTTVASPSSNISTPQTLTFSSPPSSITCTVTGKTVTNKFITII
jgi:hypothetical protein